MQLSFNQNKANLHTDRKGRWTPPPPPPPYTLTARELAAIQADEPLLMSGRRWKGGGEGGGGTGDAGGVDVGGKGRERWSRRGGNMASNKQNPN